MAVFYSPKFNETQLKDDGTLAVGYKIYTYVEGSSTPLATYTSSTGATPQANPIILNARGETANPIWLTGGSGYKLVLTTDADVVVRTEDNIRGVGDNTLTVDQWQTSGLTPTYVSATSFTLVGDQTSTFHVGRRIKSSVTAGTAYSTIATSVFGALTTITVANDSTTLDSGLSAVSYGILTTDNPAIPILKDSNFRVSGSSDKTKIIAFEVDGLTTATTRTVTVPDKNGTMAMTSDIVNEARIITNVGLLVTPNTPANSVTIALKGADGNDPSASNPVSIGFRNATLTNGQSSVVTITGALSTVISSGSTGGTVSATASRIWIAALLTGGTAELAWFNSVSGTSIAPINEGGLISTTAEGGAGAADSAQTWYSTTARASVPFTILGYFDSTQGTAGTWATSATSVVVNPRYRPGDVIQQQYTQTGAVNTGTTLIPDDDTIPQITEGDEYMTKAITFTSASNVYEASSHASLAASAGGVLALALFQDATANALSANRQNDANANEQHHLSVKYEAVCGTTSSTTFRIRAGAVSAGTMTFNGVSAARKFGGVMSSWIKVMEISA